MKTSALVLAALAAVFYVWARALPVQHIVRLTRDLATTPARVFANIRR